MSQITSPLHFSARLAPLASGAPFVIELRLNHCECPSMNTRLPPPVWRMGNLVLRSAGKMPFPEAPYTNVSLVGLKACSVSRTVAEDLGTFPSLGIVGQ